MLLIFAVPVPLRTSAQGVVWLPEEGFARAGADGFVSRVAATPGTWVRARATCWSRPPTWSSLTEVKVLEARVQELEAPSP